jgi:hypothetical protein
MRINSFITDVSTVSDILAHLGKSAGRATVWSGPAGGAPR